MEAATAMYIAAAASTASALASAQAQSVSMNIQSQQAELQGRQGALNYNKQAIAVLERQEQLRGMIRARAAAGGVNPDTGSAMSLQEYNATMAGKEFAMAKENAEMSIYGGLAQSQSLQAGAENALTLGYVNAASTAGMGYARAEAVKTPTTKMNWFS